LFAGSVGAQWHADAWPATNYWRYTGDAARVAWTNPATGDAQTGTLKDVRAADVYGALAERYAAAGQTFDTNLWPRWYRFDRSNRANAKQAISNALPYYVDFSRTNSLGQLTNLPPVMLSATGVVALASLPTNFWTSTPWRIAAREDWDAIKAATVALRWTSPGVTWTNADAINRIFASQANETETWSTWAQATNAAMADATFDAASGLAPYVDTEGVYNYADTWYIVWLDILHATATGVATANYEAAASLYLSARAVSTWGYGETPTGPGVFDANGDGVVEGVAVFTNVTKAATNATVSASVGAPVPRVPVWCDEPTTNSYGYPAECETARGYVVDGAAWVLDWTLTTNGFLYR